MANIKWSDVTADDEVEGWTLAIARATVEGVLTVQEGAALSIAAGEIVAEKVAERKAAEAATKELN